jgi:hypothetical protein
MDSAPALTSGPPETVAGSASVSCCMGGRCECGDTHPAPVQAPSAVIAACYYIQNCVAVAAQQLQRQTQLSSLKIRHMMHVVPPHASCGGSPQAC